MSSSVLSRESAARADYVAVKVCGITRVPDALAAVRLGVDAIGLNFAPHSTRYVELGVARQIAQAVRGTVTLVGVFVNPDPDQVRRTLDQVPLDLLQFHGQETAQFCGGFGKPYLKAVPMTTEFDPDAITAKFPDAKGWLVDTQAGGQFGGTGQSFDWSQWPVGAKGPWIVAGGLTPDNVGSAVTACAVHNVDVSGGVESATKGHKNSRKIAAFVRAARTAGLN